MNNNSTHKLLSIWCLALVPMLFASPSLGEQIVIPGTSISIIPSEGFVVSTAFSGLQHVDSIGSVVITEFPGDSYGEVSGLFESVESAAAGFSEKGVNISNRIAINVNGDMVPVLVGDQSINGVLVIKYMALLHGEKTILVAFSIGDPARIPESVVFDTIRSIEIVATPSIEERVRQLPFLFDEEPPFVYLEVVSGSGVSLATTGSTDPTGLLPLIIIARATRSLGPYSSSVISEPILRKLAGFEDAEIAEQKATKFAGGEGYYIVAHAGGRTVIQYLFVPPSGRYIRLIARGESQALSSVAASISKVADSVSLAE